MSEQNTVGHTIQRKKIHLEPGHFVERSGIVFKITEVLDFETAVGVNVQTGRSSALRVGELTVVSDSESRHTATTQDIQEIADEDWKIAQQRYAAIKPLLSSLVGRSDIETRSKEIGVNVATIYRWLRRYKSTGVLSALIPQKRGWSEGKSRISLFTEKIIDEVIKDIYLTHQRSSVQKVVTEVMRRCSQRGITPPHATTVRARVNRLSEKQTLRARGYKQKAKNKFSPAPGNFPDPEYPLSVVQIDHTKVDIILVDDVHRKPVGRPWITLAIDIYSRMVTGYYLSFDAPSETSVAMCVAHSILPKDEWLTLLGVDARWDVWGVMDKIHVDNGPDFRSDTFSQSCLMHGINLEFRPPSRPNFGGHIERLLGTLLTEIHDLPGTTFSSIKNREDYDSEKLAVMTKSEFEVWLVTLICKIYHQRLHSGIMMPPVKKWEIGIFGSRNSDIVGRGIPPRPVDRHSILLDFLPSFKRTIQVHGVQIDGLRYYSDVLRGWINANDPEHRNKKREFIFRRDPRSISSIWFYDPDLKQYFQIPYANQSLPSMSLWEHREVRAKIKKEGSLSVNEHEILKAFTELQTHVEASKEKSKKSRRMSQRRTEHQKAMKPLAIALTAPIPSTTGMAPSGFATFSDENIEFTGKIA